MKIDYASYVGDITNDTALLRYKMHSADAYYAVLLNTKHAEENSTANSSEYLAVEVPLVVYNALLVPVMA